MTMKEGMNVNVGVILAAGRGERFGGEVPKQFAEVLGRPVLAYTLSVFQRAADIDAIEVVCQPEHARRVADIARREGVGKLRWITPGGDSCPASIRNGFCALRPALADGDSVVLHMGVSPLVSGQDISRALEVCRERGCCFTMHPVYICMAQGGGDGWAGRDAPKERYVELNTPWAFNYGEVYGLYSRLEEEGRPIGENDYTLGLWLAAGKRAWYARGGEAGRLKITTAHDRDMFEAYLLWQEARERQGK